MTADEVRALVAEEIPHGGFPGAACSFGIAGGPRTAFVAGRQTYGAESPAISLPESLWDLASLTKVIATTTLAMIAVERGALELDRPVAAMLPSFGQNGKDRITPRHLLTHESGLVAFRRFHLTRQATDAAAEEVFAAIDSESLQYEPGTTTVYSDLSMIVLARMLEAIANEPLAELFHREVAAPLGLSDTGYLPGFPAMSRTPIGDRAVPTEVVEPWRTEWRRSRFAEAGMVTRFGVAPEFVQGEVHDPTATILGGVAGHAGLFSTLPDLVRFAEKLLAERPELVRRATIDGWTTRQSERSSRALGWDTKSPVASSAGSCFGPRSFGHTGYTGTSIWIDPDARRYAILLTNRVHPTDENDRILAFRPRLHDAIWAALDASG